MSIIVTDTYPIHTIVTEGYTQAPCPAPVAPTKAQAAYDAMSLQSLADAIQAKTGTQFKTGAQLLEEKRQEEEEAKAAQQADIDATSDVKVITEICDAIKAGDSSLALNGWRKLRREAMQTSAMRALTHVFGPIVTCPCCDERGGWNWRDDFGDVDADCDMCDCLGIVPQRKLDEEAAAVAREYAAMVA